MGCKAHWLDEMGREKMEASRRLPSGLGKRRGQASHYRIAPDVEVDRPPLDAIMLLALESGHVAG